MAYKKHQKARGTRRLILLNILIALLGGSMAGRWETAQYKHAALPFMK